MNGRLGGLMRGTLIYGVGQALSRAMTLLLVPVLTAYLDPAAYGTLAVLTAFGLLLTTVFSVGLGAATAPSYFERDQKGPTIWTAFAMLCVSATVMLALCLAFAPAIARLILHDQQYARMVLLSAGAAAFSILSVPFRQFLMFEERPMLSVSCSLGSLAVSLILTVWLVAGLHRGVSGVLEADLIAQGITCGLFALPVLRHARFAVRPRLARELFALGLPLIPAFASVFVLQHGSRYILQWLRGPGEVGLYALGVNLAGAVGLFVAGFQSAWMPYFMRFSQRRDEAVHAFGRVATYYMIGVGAASLLLYLFARPAVMLLSGPEYRGAEHVVGLAASAQLLSGSFLVLIPGLYFTREVKYIGIIQALAAVAAVGLNWLLAPRFGAVGRAAAVVASYVLLNGGQLWWNRRRRYLDVAYDWPRLRRFSLLYVTVAAATFVPRDLSLLAEVAISAGGTAVLAAAIWRLLQPDERLRLRQTWAGGASPCSPPQPRDSSEACELVMPVTERMTVYGREPLEVRDGIPAFSVPDDFVRNYERISADHLASLEAKGTNPWIPERLWQAMEATTIALIDKYSRPGDAILDVGVGLARILSHFPGLRRFGMDISWGYLNVARAKGVEVCYARIEDMPYRPNTFDVLVCTDVLEHVLDLNLCCQKLLDTVKPGGVLIVRVPVHEDLSRYIDPAFPYEFVHLRNFTEPSLRLLFERILRCDVIEVTPGGYWPLGDRLKLTLPFGQVFSIGFRVFDRIPVIRSIFYQPIVERLYHPIDANVVVRRRPARRSDEEHERHERAAPATV